MAAKRRGLSAKIEGNIVTLYAGERRDWRGIGDDAREYLSRLKTSKAKAHERLRKRRAHRKVRLDDPGLESFDYTPKNARGLVLTEVMLPQGVTSDAALIAFWVLENVWTHVPARAITAEIAAAQRVLAERGRRARVWLSDHDRASLKRYKAAPSVVLTAAALARAPANRTR